MFNNMKKVISYIVLTSVFISLYSIAEAKSLPYVAPATVRVDLVNDAGKAFRKYPIHSSANLQRAYIQATNRQQYNLRIRNLSNRRIGVVVTVDGRNILSGKKSWLRSNEKMYILNPYETSVYKGWRTAHNRVNRFFFTNAGNSYSAAWGDKSAMGVIAVAAFYEKPHRAYRHSAPMFGSKSRRAAPAAGTGFGRAERSESRTVEFTPLTNSFFKHFYKYEWRNSLCKRGIIVCRATPKKKPQNRFWQDSNRGYAPPPPRR